MPWARFQLALTVLAVDPVAVGGLWLRARCGPVRQIALEALLAAPLPLPSQRLSPEMGDDALFGGLDAAATLKSGRPILRPGLLDRPAVLTLVMAERCPVGLAARLAQALDQQRHALIALDEGAEPGEGLAPALADRLGLFVDLTAARAPPAPLDLLAPDRLEAARHALPQVRLPHAVVTRIVTLCDMLGIASPRAPLLCLRASRALAALAGRDVVDTADVEQAAGLTLAHRAAPPPDIPDHPPPPPPAPDAGGPAPDSPGHAGGPMDMLVQSVRAALPADLLADLAEGRATRAARTGAGTGRVRAGNHRGAPLPPRRGRPQAQARIDLTATLRAAAPWQVPRRAAASPGRVLPALLIEPQDLHIRRVRETSDRVLIFAVDASSSSAMARLAEAKGAVELLLAQAYSRRDHVALLTFRGQRADLLLPPTRSLVQTKHRLRGMLGGGGTPLVHGLQLAMTTAQKAQGRGMTPTIALLTDGRGNIALDGQANRALASAQAHQMALAIHRAGTPALVINTALRAQPDLAGLARTMGARYIDLPRPTAGRLASVLGAALEA